MATAARSIHPDREWRVGDLLADVYEIRDVITNGGMGLVYRVWHHGWRTELAVKTPRRELIRLSAQLSRFHTEAETWVNLGSHTHTVKCLYVRRIDSLPCVFAEWIDGGSLADAIRTRRLYVGSPDAVIGRILDVAIQAAWGLEFAHSRQLVHQDVKPANVMLTIDGIAKVTDFGLARAAALTAGVAGWTGPGASVSAPFGGMTQEYCSPEQANAYYRGAHTGPAILTRATDVWSWAVMLWEMFLGERPCTHGQVAAEAFDQFRHDMWATRGLPAMPRDVVDLLGRCLNPDPNVRPRDMGEIADELVAAFGDCVDAAFDRAKPDSMAPDADGLANRALSLVDLGLLDQAEHAWRRALSVDRWHPQAVYNYGLFRWRAGQITAQHFIAELETLRAHHPGQAVCDYFLGAVHLECGHRDAASTELLHAASIAPHDPDVAASLLALSSELGGEFQAAWNYVHVDSKALDSATAVRRSGFDAASERRSFDEYTVVQRLVQTDFAEVFLVRHDQMPSPVVMHLVRGALAADEKARERFLTEIAVAARLFHAHVLRPLDAGVTGERVWFVVDHMSTSAATVLLDHGPMHPARALRIVTQIARALDYCHDRGVIHRIVNPGRIYLDTRREGQPERAALADFGMAAITVGDDPVALGEYIGTRWWMAPEELRGELIDATVDVFGLGCTLYTLVTGEPPYGRGFSNMIRAVLTGPPPAPSRTPVGQRIGLPPAFDAVIARSVATKKSQRYATCGELAWAAQRALYPQAQTNRIV